MLDGIEELVVLIKLDDIGGDALLFAVIVVDELKDFYAARVGEGEGEIGFFTIAETDAGADFANCPGTGKIPGDNKLLSKVWAKSVRVGSIDMI